MKKKIAIKSNEEQNLTLVEACRCPHISNISEVKESIRFKIK